MNYALIFAGGVGSRMNTKAKPKQFLEIHGKPIIVHTIEHFDQHPEIDAVCVVCVKEWLSYMKGLVERFHLQKVKWVIPGGATALESQYLGLNHLRENTDITGEDVVLIHDGVRPLIDMKLISDCIEGVKEYGSAITVVPATETVIRTTDNNMIKDTILRSECKLARAPQAFCFGDIMGAHDSQRGTENYTFVDSTTLMMFCGYSLHTVDGPTENIKVTNPEDFYICRALLDAKENSQIFGI